MKKVLLGTLLTLATLNAVAQEETESTKTGLYIGIGSTGTAIDIGDDDTAIGSASLKFGYAINKNFAIEARFIGESDDEDIGNGEEMRIDSAQTIYMRYSLGNETFDPYILLGISKIEGTITGTDRYYSYYGYTTYYTDYKTERPIYEDEVGMAIGIGANWNINETFSITGDWTVPAEDTVQFNLGLDIKF